MRKEIIAIGILAMIAVCATLATAASSQSVNSNNGVPVIEIEMTPDTLNLDGNGKYITAFIDKSVLGDIPPKDLYLTEELDDSGFKIYAVAAVDYDTYWAVKFLRALVLAELDVYDVPTTRIETIEDLYVKHQTLEGVVDFIATDDFTVLKTKKSNK